jgi:integrase
MVKRTIPKGNNKSKDRGYSRAEIQKLLSIASIRDQAMITLIASTGMRRGALPLLRKRNLIPLDDYKIYEIIVYEGEGEQYHTYTTPEARLKLDAYLAYREQYGETLTPDSFVFRKDWNLRNRKAAAIATPITEKTITAALDQLANKSGVRKKQHVGHRKDSNAAVVGRKAGRVRYQQKLIHGLRKFFESALLDVGFPENWLDMLEGHKLKGLRENYYRPKDNTVLLGTTTADGKVHLPGFLDLMGELTLDDSERLQLKVVKLEQKEKEIEKRIREEVQKEVAQHMHDLISQNPSLINARPVELAKLKPHQL